MINRCFLYFCSIFYIGFWINHLVGYLDPWTHCTVLTAGRIILLCVFITTFNLANLDISKNHIFRLVHAFFLALSNWCLCEGTRLVSVKIFTSIHFRTNGHEVFTKIGRLVADQLWCLLHKSVSQDVNSS